VVAKSISGLCAFS